MGDPARCGTCGFFFCRCTSPVETANTPFCEGCGGCMGSCEGFDFFRFSQINEKCETVLCAPNETVFVELCGNGSIIIVPLNKETENG